MPAPFGHRPVTNQQIDTLSESQLTDYLIGLLGRILRVSWMKWFFQDNLPDIVTFDEVLRHSYPHGFSVSGCCRYISPGCDYCPIDAA